MGAWAVIEWLIFGAFFGPAILASIAAPALVAVKVAKSTKTSSPPLAGRRKKKNRF